MANFSTEFDKLSVEIVNSAQEINKILCTARIDSYLCSNDFDKSLATIQKTGSDVPPIPTCMTDSDHRPTSQDIDTLFEVLRQRPKQLAKSLQKKTSNPQLLKTVDDSLVSSPKKTIELFATVHKNQELLRSIRSDGIESLEVPKIGEKQKQFAQHLQNTIKDYQNVCQILQKNTTNASKASSACPPVDDVFNEALKKLTQTMANVTFIKTNETLPDISEPQPNVQSPLVACLDEIIEEVRSNEQ
jgi:hypothetical protein